MVRLSVRLTARSQKNEVRPKTPRRATQGNLALKELLEIAIHATERRRVRRLTNTAKPKPPLPSSLTLDEAAQWTCRVSTVLRD